MYKNLKIFIILNDLPFFISHRLPLALEAKKRGLDVHVLAPYHKKSFDIINEYDLKFHHIPLKRSGRNPISELKLFIAMWKVISKNKPNLIHFVSMKPVLYGGIIARLLNIQGTVNAVTGLGFLFVTSNFFTRILRIFVFIIYRFSLNHKNSISIFQNNDDLRLFLDRNLVEKRKTIMIKGCGVDIEEFRPKSNLMDNTIVMFPARIIGDKGANEFFDAAIRLKEEGIAAKFVLVGKTDPDNPTNIDKKKIKKLVEKDIIEWWGFSENMNETLSKATIVCLPSYREGLPKVLIESAALEKPIVTTDVPGCREIVINEKNGLLVPVKDSINLSLALKKLIQNKDMQKNMGLNGRKLVVKNFTTQDFIFRSMNVYETILKKIY
ncbi:MAG: N,N'-diacetylbacillosaminyl-diphospho-undecaprenol alpha-1,3-N-acetylgalactosaminyltransferase [Alphaproteobacteria bacterium MarineAlpha2_Bin1]|nr:MAG: N,N'-diacetylbacillosaminyl-diphospho-undecaprenol alpha-1,3-N-acetylgalactosaminyltransferase [Alphaproteobacteria bacterium MarineAlpha2_Bin1]|tara:strand:+ start:448 stop:1590 length:1143 start_codon:yes stop_codon:yes gene_type:complete